jgi:hypothetical protein
MAKLITCPLSGTDRDMQGLCSTAPSAPGGHPQQLQGGYAVTDQPEEKKPFPTDELHERARKVQATLKRLLKEINELLDKTKNLPKPESEQATE